MIAWQAQEFLRRMFYVEGRMPEVWPSTSSATVANSS